MVKNLVVFYHNDLIWSDYDERVLHLLCAVCVCLCVCVMVIEQTHFAQEHRKRPLCDVYAKQQALQSPSISRAWSQSERMSIPFLVDSNGHVLAKRIFLDHSDDEVCFA